MQGYLNKNKIEYILFHLRQFVEIKDGLIEKLLFLPSSNNISENQGKVIFLLSAQELKDEKIVIINDVPVLFPNSPLKEWYTFDNNNLIFNHDILKSAFYLLSCYQEFNSTSLDSKGRFLYNGSIQDRLNIAHKPIVNYYFEIIAKGLELFCKNNGLSHKITRQTNHLNLFLSHDIDKIDYYSLNGFLLKCKELFFLTPTNYTFYQNINLLLKQFFYLFIPKKEDPFWDFDYLLKLEDKYKFCSAFYFLHKDIKHYDGYYTFNMPKIKQLFNMLQKNNKEIGLHNSLGAVNNLNKTKIHLSELIRFSPCEIKGIRQHFLKISIPESIKLFQKAGLIYDTSVCFAEYEGFRSSYCYPHKLYDFDSDQIIDIWEIPLSIMDCSLYSYRKLNFDDAFIQVQEIMEETKKFGGVVSFLWHNGNFDELQYPGITKFYEKILENFYKNNCNSLTGIETINYFDPN